MADSTLNAFVGAGTTAERTSFVPAPPTPATGPDPGYVFWDTDLQQEFAYDFGLSDWVVIGSSPSSLGTALEDLGNSGTTKNIDFDTLPFGRKRVTLTGNVTFTLLNPYDGGVYVVLLYTGAGSFTYTFGASVKWPGGVAPTATATAARLDLVTMIWDDTASVYYGSFNQDYTP